MKRFLFSSFISSLLMVTLLGAGCGKVIKQLQEKIPSGSETVVQSENGKLQMTVPAGWVKNNTLHKSAELGAAYSFHELYAVVLSESKEDFSDMTLQHHSDLTRGSLVEEVTNVNVSSPVSLNVGGNAAIQYEIRATVDGVNIVYLHTTVETPKNYHQVLAWTLKSKFEENKSILQKVTASLRELP